MSARGCIALGLLVFASCARPERRASIEEASEGVPAPVAATPSAAGAPVARFPDRSPQSDCDAFARPGVLRRAPVVRVVEAGLGRWLAAGVEVDAHLRRGRFQGWIVRRLYDGDPCYSAIDVRPGDVVTRVNGKSVERPDEANAIFTALRTAPALVIELTRNGEKRKVALAIEDAERSDGGRSD